MSESETDARTFATDDHEVAVQSRHTLTIGDRSLHYTATAGTILLDDADGQPGVEVFYVAYTLDDAEGPRPLSFFFNGGPGSPSSYLHLASVAPVRVVTGAVAPTPADGYQLIDNEHSIIDRTDLVFIDAPGTGFSHILSDAAATEVLGVDEDARAFARTITRYLSIYDRWNSPKYLVGESYGTTRAAVLARELFDTDIAVSGIVLVSSILNFGERMVLSDQHYIGLLPTFAAVAWYHGKAGQGRELEDVTQEARAYAQGDFARALARGQSLPDVEREAVAARVAEVTGLDATYVSRSFLRVEPNRFRKELLRESGEIIGFYDGRYVGADLDAAGEQAGYGVDSAYIASAITTTANDYIRRVLGFNPRRARRHRGDFTSRTRWNWNHAVPGRDRWSPLPWGNTIGDLAHVLVRHPTLKVLVASGYYDLCTPFAQSEFDIDHLLVSRPLQENIAFRYYGAGHMMYLTVAELTALADDLRTFIDAPVSALASFNCRPGRVRSFDTTDADGGV